MANKRSNQKWRRLPGKINPLRSEEFENEGGFMEFKIGDLLKGQTGDVDLQQIDVNGKGTFFINSGLDNLGIKGRTDKTAKVFPANTISIDFWGNAFYRPFEYKMATHNHVFSMSGECIKNENVGLYISSSLSYLNQLFSFNAMGTLPKISECSITLPTKQIGESSNNKINFDYMERYILNFQEEYLKKVNEFLTEKKLSLSLSEQEEKAIRLFNEGRIPFKEVQIGSLFNIHPTRSYKLTNKDLFRTIGKIPVVANSSTDNGIGGWTSLKPTELGNKVVFSDTTTSDSIFYQPQDFVGYPHVQGLYSNDNNWTENTLMYLTVTFRKSAVGLFNYGNKFTREIAKKMVVSIPINQDNSVDYDFMDKFISAQKKLVTQRVSNWVKQKLLEIKISKQADFIPGDELNMAADSKADFSTKKN